MNKAGVLHLSESFMAYAKSLDELNIRIRSDKEDDLDISLLYTYKFDEVRKWEEIEMEKSFEDEIFSYYEVDVKLLDKRFSYIFMIKEGDKSYYLCESGIHEEYDFANFCFTSDRKSVV